jgi:hypothetical protein
MQSLLNWCEIHLYSRVVTMSVGVCIGLAKRTDGLGNVT